MSKNVDEQTVNGFGYEWTTFDQTSLPAEELKSIFESYFSIFPWNKLPNNAIGFDLGCGSGRWAKFAALRVGKLHCIDASAEALEVAERNLKKMNNCMFHHASVDGIPFDDGTMDFGYSLGVLHHVPDTSGGIKSCVDKLKQGAPFLIYLYYDFDNRPSWFRILWKISDLMRRVIYIQPNVIKYSISQIIACLVYLPLARLSLVIEKAGVDANSIPLSFYKNRSFYVMRTDAMDRFCTKLEKRFSRKKIYSMMAEAGLENIVFSEHPPYWCAIGYKR